MNKRNYNGLQRGPIRTALHKLLAGYSSTPNNLLTCRFCGQTPNFIDTFNNITTAMDDCLYWKIDSIVPSIEVANEKHEKQPCESPYFDHEYVQQSGPGISGDDYHGFVFLPINSQFYVKVEYAT